MVATSIQVASLSTALCESIRYQAKSEQNVRQDPIPRVRHWGGCSLHPASLSVQWVLFCQPAKCLVICHSASPMGFILPACQMSRYLPLCQSNGFYYASLPTGSFLPACKTSGFVLATCNTNGSLLSACHVNGSVLPGCSFSTCSAIHVL